MDTRPIRSRMTEMLVIGALLFPTELMADARSPVKLLLDSAQTGLQAQAVNSLVSKLEREQRSIPEFQSQRSAVTSEAALETETLPPIRASFPAAAPVSAASTEPPEASDTEPSSPGSGAETSVIRPGQNSLALTDSKIEPQTFPAAAPTPSKSPAEIANAEPVTAAKPTAQRAKPEVTADQIASALVTTPQEAAAPSMPSVSKPLPRADTTAPKNQKPNRTETEKLPKHPASSRTIEDFIPELDVQRLPKRYRRMLEAYGL
jgi:hypothetical protein